MVKPGRLLNQATQGAARHFSPWLEAPDRSCWTCTNAIGYDGIHLWCERARMVVVMPCGRWERCPGSD